MLTRFTPAASSCNAATTFPYYLQDQVMQKDSCPTGLLQVTVASAPVAGRLRLPRDSVVTRWRRLGPTTRSVVISRPRLSNYARESQNGGRELQLGKDGEIGRPMDVHKHRLEAFSGQLVNRLTGADTTLTNRWPLLAAQHSLLFQPGKSRAQPPGTRQAAKSHGCCTGHKPTRLTKDDKQPGGNGALYHSGAPNFKLNT
ncbi:hypothetical protein J6590_016814 [Homalodisca vitripennis]|nr:hypothetical protein J6590_016814 [Homalodisca vitripennis]